MHRNSLSSLLLLAALVGPACPLASASTVVVIEPDDYPDGTVLNTVSPWVTLSTGAFGDNRPTFDVTAVTESSLGHPSTGVKVFAHSAGVPFFNSDRSFRMDFDAPPQRIEVDYIASGFSSESYLGRLEAYSAAGNLLGAVETALLSEGQIGTLSLSTPGIAYAVAYPPDDPFGDFDYLRITVPEPACLTLVAVGAALGAPRRSGR